jgi:hypothetical protein
MRASHHEHRCAARLLVPLLLSMVWLVGCNRPTPSAVTQLTRDAREGMPTGGEDDVSRIGLFLDKFTSDDDDEDESASPRRTAASIGPNEH